MSETPPTVRDFADVLREFESGNVHYDLTEQLQQLISSVMDTRKQGTLTLTMVVAPTGKGTVTMATDVKLKEPKHDRPTTSFFVDGKFQLHRDDPRQAKMDLRTPIADDSDLPEALREVPEDNKGLRVVAGEEQ